MPILRELLVRIIGPLERSLGCGTLAELNLLRHLGSLTVFFLWIVLISGIWLFIFFSTSVDAAYSSVESLTLDQWYLGGVMRSLHRYASDAAVITIGLHLVKEFAFDRYRGPRWFSWFSGVGLLWLVIPLGITGYWLVWDRLAQYVALSTAEFLDWLPIFTDPMARNFLSDESLSDRFFTLMAFLHLIGLPLFLVFGIWIHVVRITGPRINPPRLMMAATLLAMLSLSIIFPATSQGPAAFNSVISVIGVDWFYLAAYPLMQLLSPGWLWLILTALSVILCALPWLPRKKKTAQAQVNLEFCNGCERCVDDCPFDALAMGPRTDGSSFLREAVVDPDLCVGCGICTGSCPTATPFRTRSGMVPGIDLPDLPVDVIKSAVNQAATTIQTSPRVLVFACQGSAEGRELESAGEAVVWLRCMAQLPPPFVDYVLSRALADGVFMAGCLGGDCRYRLGAAWTSQRMQRERDPRLRQRVDGQRVALGWDLPWNQHTITDAAAAFRASLADSEKSPKKPSSIRSWWAPALAIAAMTAAAGWLSSSPTFQLLDEGTAMLSLSFSHAGQRLVECRRLSQEELNELPPNMRKPADCPRQRHPVEIRLEIDGQLRWHQVLPPSGLWDDGESNVYHRVPLSPGTSVVTLAMADNGVPGDWRFHYEKTLDLAEAQHVLVGFDPNGGTFVVRD